MSPAELMLRELTGNPPRPEELTQGQREWRCHCGCASFSRHQDSWWSPLSDFFVCTRCGDHSTGPVDWTYPG